MSPQRCAVRFELSGANIYGRIYTFDMGVLSKLVETARLKYLEVSRPHIIVHAMDTMVSLFLPFPSAWSLFEMRRS